MKNHDENNRVLQRFSRRHLIKGAGIVGLGMTVSQAKLIRTLGQESEALDVLLNTTATLEAFAVTLFGYATESALQNGYDKPVSDDILEMLVAARAAEHYHLDYLLKAGAEPITQTFTISDPVFLTNYDTFFSALAELEALFVATYIATAREFTTLQQPDLVKVAYMVATVESEHRALAHFALGTAPANNRAFAVADIDASADAIQILRDRGFIESVGQEIQYPGPGDIDRGSIRYRAPYGPDVACMPGNLATPVATPMS